MGRTCSKQGRDVLSELLKKILCSMELVSYLFIFCVYFLILILYGVPNLSDIVPSPNIPEFRSESNRGIEGVTYN
jgi:hypothetical protein